MEGFEDIAGRDHGIFFCFLNSFRVLRLMLRLMLLMLCYTTTLSVLHTALDAV